MIDLHIHILPGVDDGSSSMEESLRMAAIAADCGVREMAVTPHCNLPEPARPLLSGEVRKHMQNFQAVLDQTGIPIRLYPGMEIFGKPDTAALLRRGDLLTLADSRYPLIEFPFHRYGEEATEVLGNVLDLGLRPLVAHPERYRYVQQDPRLVNLWADMGCLLQINRGSLLGRFGEQTEAMAFALLERNFVTCIASDAHRSSFRTPMLKDVYALVSEEMSPETAEQLMHRNPEVILHNPEIRNTEPDWF